MFVVLNYNLAGGGGCSEILMVNYAVIVVVLVVTNGVGWGSDGDGGG